MSARVEISSLGLAGFVSFLVDTGADSTVLAPTDARKIGFDYGTTDEPPVLSYGIGGAANTSVLSASLVFFDHEDRCLYGYEMTRFSILHPTDVQPLGDRKLTGDVSRRVPSLLGRDVLDCWCLTCDKVNNNVSAIVHRSDAVATLQ